jgi:hypothetical protein
MKNCPFCAEQIQDAAIVCKHCCRELSDVSAIAVRCAADKGRRRPRGVGGLALLLALLGSIRDTAARAGAGTSEPAVSSPLGTDILWRQYERELDRHDKIVASLTLPVGVLTALGGGLGVLLQKFSYELIWPTRVFVTVAAMDAVAIVLTVYFLVRCYFGQKYGYLPRLVQLQGHYDALRKYHETYSNASGNADSDFEDYLRDKLIEANERSSFSNDEKSAFRYRASQCLTAVLVLTVVSSVPYGVDVIQQVRHDRPSSVTPTSGFDNIQLKESPMADNPKPTPLPPKPVGPDIRVLKEGTRPKK